MAFYKSPIRPIDPVVPEEQSGPIRYVRDSFEGTGQDSHTNPPAQSPEMWQSLVNVMPIHRRTLDRRYGYSLFNLFAPSGFPPGQATLANVSITQLATYANDLTGYRGIWLADGGDADCLDEVTHVSTSSPGLPLHTGIARMISSRNFAYVFQDTGAFKWNGPGTTYTKTGIDVNATTGLTTGPNGASTVVDLANAARPWTTPNNIKLHDGLTAVSTVLSGPSTTNFLQLSNFGLSASGKIVGIQVDTFGTATVVPSGGGSTATNIVRPTTFSGAFANPPFAFDNNLTTFATGNASASFKRQETWNGFSNPSIHPQVGLTLSVSAGGHVTNTIDPGDPGHTAGFLSGDYSLDGGITWHNLYAFGGSTNITVPQATRTATLPAGQDLSLVQFRATTDGTDGATFTTHQVYEIFLTQTVSTAPPPPLGSTFLHCNLIKGGVQYGATKSGPVTTTLGGSNDLWNGVWTVADINDPTFGLIFSCETQVSGSNTTFFMDYIQVTVFLAGAGPVITSTANAGNVTLTVGRIYYLSAKNGTTGHYSDLSDVSISTGPLTGKEINLNLPVFTDPQVDTKALLASADGGDPTELFLVTELPNGTATFIDNTPEQTLLQNQQMLFTDEFGNEFGVAGNTPPPTGMVLAAKHKGRLWGLVGQNLYFSKSISELTLPNGFVAGKYEEAWPADNYFDISQEAESGTGLLSDGNVLYIASPRHVRVLFGDNPENFQEPEVVHQEVGVLSPEVWKVIYVEGTPGGAIWLTPDNRVIGSDFNTYTDIGHPIQDVLNTINKSATVPPHAMFVSDGPFDLYILAIPTGDSNVCDTHCVYDVRAHQWFIWQPTDPSSAMLFNVTATGEPQWIFAKAATDVGDDRPIYQYISSAVQDRVGNTPVDFPVSATTSWMHFGMPTHRKLLNEIEIIGDQTMNVTVKAASTQADFVNPFIAANTFGLTVDPLGHYKVFLAAQTTKARYYQFVFSSNSESTDFLDSYNILAIPVHSL